MDKQNFGLGLLCAVTIGVTASSLNVTSTFHEPVQAGAQRRDHMLAETERYGLVGFQAGSQGTQKIVAGSDVYGEELENFFQSFGHDLDARQTSLSSDEQRLIWDNLDELLS